MGARGIREEEAERAVPVVEMREYPRLPRWRMSPSFCPWLSHRVVSSRLSNERRMRHNKRRVCLNGWKRDQGGVVERAVAWLMQGTPPLHPTAPCALSLPPEVSSQVGQATPPSGYQTTR